MPGRRPRSVPPAQDGVTSRVPTNRQGVGNACRRSLRHDKARSAYRTAIFVGFALGSAAALMSCRSHMSASHAPPPADDHG